jgi:hypothetical protein
VARDAIVAQYGGICHCLPAMMGDGIKDDMMLHGIVAFKVFYDGEDCC